MRKISLLVHEDVYSSSVAGVIDLFAGANWCLGQFGKSPAFKLELVSEKVKNIQLDAPAQFMCYATIEEVIQTDLIIIPGFNGNIKTILKKNTAIINWIKEMNNSGTEVASMCIGAVSFWQRPELLNGKVATSYIGRQQMKCSCNTL